MNDGLVDERIKKKVLKGLKKLVSGGGVIGSNGDIKERGNK